MVSREITGGVSDDGVWIYGGVDWEIPYLGEHEEVVAVEVHGVVGGEVVFDDDADGGVAAEVVDVPLLWEGVLAELPLFTDRMGKGDGPGRWGRMYCQQRQGGRSDGRSWRGRFGRSCTTICCRSHWGQR